MRAWCLFAGATLVPLVLVTACADDDDKSAATTTSATSGSGAAPPDCLAQCDMDHPDGVMPYAAYQGCVFCGACYDRCEPELPVGDPMAMQCLMPNELGCSAGAANCTECATGTVGFECWSGYDFETMDPVNAMAPCYDVYNACNASMECLALSECYRVCNQG
jgi:hypothetical protein